MDPNLSRRTLLTLTGAALSTSALAADGPDAGGWQTRAPGAAGFDTGRLNAALDVAMGRKSVSLLVVRHGRLVAERYAPQWAPDRQREIASAGKSLVATLIGMAIDAGRIKGLDQPAADFIPQWRETSRQAIRIRHLLNMTSGIDDRGLALRGVVGDQFALNAAAPLADPPGARWRYNTAIYHLLFHILARATGERFEDYAQRALLGPLGMSQTRWITSQGQGAAGPVTNYYTAACSGRDLARFGQFAQQGGVWAGRRLVSQAYMKAGTAPSQSLNPSYGLLWWVNAAPGFNAAGRVRGLRFEGSPPDTFAAMGAGGQLCMVTPSLGLVVVRQGENPGVEAMPAELMAGVVAALKG